MGTPGKQGDREGVHLTSEMGNEVFVPFENKGLSQTDKEQLRSCLADYGMVFATCPQETKRCKDFEFTLQPIEDILIYDRPQRYSPEKLKIIGEQIDDMLETGTIRESTSLHNSRLVLVKKKMVRLAYV